MMDKNEMRIYLAEQTKVWSKSNMIDVQEPEPNKKVILKARRAYDPTVDKSTNRKPKMSARVKRPDEMVA